MKKQEYFEITSVSRADLEQLGFDTRKVDDATMRKIASKMGDDYCEQLYWGSLGIFAEHYGVPKKKKGIPYTSRGKEKS